MVRDGGRCVVPGCGSTEGLVCDHVETRPNSDLPTRADRLDNLRMLCGRHDQMAKEKSSSPGASRRQPRVIGCDASGMPLDPAHPWRA
jgi:hypothetical protein